MYLLIYGQRNYEGLRRLRAGLGLLLVLLGRGLSVCSGCQDGGSPYDQEQTFGRLSPFSTPIFGGQMPVRRRTYRTRSVNRLLAPEGR